MEKVERISLGIPVLKGSQFDNGEFEDSELIDPTVNVEANDYICIWLDKGSIVTSIKFAFTYQATDDEAIAIFNPMTSNKQRIILKSVFTWSEEAGDSILYWVDIYTGEVYKPDSEILAFTGWKGSN